MDLLDTMQNDSSGRRVLLCVGYIRDEVGKVAEMGGMLEHKGQLEVLVWDFEKLEEFGK